MEDLVARVAVDVPLPHLDKPFDYAIPAGMGVRPGVRVRVRFAGRLVDGYVLSVGPRAAADRKLAEIHRLISPEVVVSEPMLRLARRVADHYCGTLVDVLRLAVPKRHATAERAESPVFSEPDFAKPARVLPRYPAGESFLAALTKGGSPRASWVAVPVADEPGEVATGVLEAAAATLSSGRSVLVLVPDQERLDRLLAQASARFGRKSVLALNAELGPATRYRHFLAVKRGAVRIVLGTRSAVFAPVPNLGLLAVLDEGSDLYAERRAPYWQAREVAALRVAQEPCALLFAGPARSVEAQRWVTSGWLGEIRLPGEEVRRLAPLVRVASDTDFALVQDEYARVARLPHDVFSVIRAGLASGPVLVQVPRSGYLVETATGSQVGVRRSAEELGKAFPRTPVIVSSGEQLVSEVPDRPALIVTTPGAEPIAAQGYPAAIILDVAVALGRSDLRAAEESLRRWFQVTSLVRPAALGGTVLLVGPVSSPTIQALVRLDSVGFAERELAARAEVGWPPAVKLVELSGSPADLASIQAALVGVAPGVWGPIVESPDSSVSSSVATLTGRCAVSEGTAVIQALRTEISRRSAKKLPPVRVQVDPVGIG